MVLVITLPSQQAPASQALLACSSERPAAPRMSCNVCLDMRCMLDVVHPMQVIFDDAFWTGIDVVINALDNVTARLYVDSRCVYFGRPLLESGTLGAKANTQVVVPNVTENYGALHRFTTRWLPTPTCMRCAYVLVPTVAMLKRQLPIVHTLFISAGASRDPPEKQAPMCTLHSFPHNIDHCLTFARSEFEGLLEKPPAEANAFLSDPTKCVLLRLLPKA